MVEVPMTMVAGGAGGGDTKRVPGDPVVTSLADAKWTTEEVMTSLTGSDFGGGPSGSGGRLLRRLPYSSLLSGSSASRQAAFTPNHLRQSVRIATSLPPILWSHVTAQERVESNSESKLVRKIDVDGNV